jgi:hypothetical protein
LHFHRGPVGLQAAFFAARQASEYSVLGFSVNQRQHPTNASHAVFVELGVDLLDLRGVG